MAPSLVNLVKEAYWLLCEFVPDSLFYLLITLRRLLGLSYDAIITPSEGFWLVQTKNGKIFIPSPRFFKRSLTRKDILGKYSFDPYVRIEAGDIVFDVGAYVGRFSVAVADVAEKVFAFEPAPSNCGCLRKNTEHLRNVMVIEKALWTKNGIMDLYVGTRPSDSLDLDDRTKYRKYRPRKIRVESVRLDTFASKLGIREIDFLKIDAEGAEPEVLEGARDILPNIRKIAVDCGAERFGETTTSQVKELLSSLGFDVYASPKDMVYARAIKNDAI